MKFSLNIGLLLPVFVIIIFNDSAFAGDELLSLDKSVIIQFVIFIASIFILNSLFFKPLLGISDRRENLTKGTVKEANELSEKVQQIIGDYEAKIGDARSEASEKRAELRREAQLAAEGMISEVRKETQNHQDPD